MDAGLERVVAAETVLSDVDGAAGRLVIRGYPIETLAGHASFEEIVHLLWDGFFSDLPHKRDLRAALGAARAEVFGLLRDRDAPWIAGLQARTILTHQQCAPEGARSEVGGLTAVEALRIGLAHIPDGDDLATALRLVAGGAVFTAAIARAERGLAPVAPDPDAGHAADLLRMLSGVAPSKAQSSALDAYLVTVADHGLNASTFAARVAASTRAGLASAVIAGLSALKGPLHGGAPGPVLDMLDAIGAPENAEAWIEGALARGERLMGFGHRVYRVRDPRADALKAAIARLPKTAGRLAFAEAIEKAALTGLAERYPTRRLETNVEFYTALLLEALCIPRDAFTCVFACGRLAGWIAHAREQEATGRLVRPRSVYRGPTPRAAA